MSSKGESAFQTKVLKFMGSIGLLALRYDASASGHLEGFPDIIVFNNVDAPLGDWTHFFLELKDFGGSCQSNQKLVAELISPFGATYVCSTPREIEELVLKLTGTKKKLK